MAEERLDKIEQEFNELKKDLQGISKTLQSLAANKANQAQNAAQNLAQEALARGEEWYGDVRDQLHSASRAAGQQVKNNPLSTLAVVAAVGFALGFLTRR